VCRAVGSELVERERREVDEATRRRRLHQRHIMEKERRKAIQAARRRLREAKHGVSSWPS